MRDIKVSRVLWGPGNCRLEILIATAMVGGQKFYSCDCDKPCFPQSCTGRGSCGQTGSLFMAAEACNSSALPCLKETKGHKGYLGIYCGNLDDQRFQHTCVGLPETWVATGMLGSYRARS